MSNTVTHYYARITVQVDTGHQLHLDVIWTQTCLLVHFLGALLSHRKPNYIDASACMLILCSVVALSK